MQRGAPGKTVARGTWHARAFVCALFAAALIAGIGCGEDPDPLPTAPLPGPPHARWDQVREFRADLARERDASDGAGRVRVVESPDRVVAGQPARWSFEFEVSEHGIAEGGRIEFFPEPFWGWSTPQTSAPAASGYTRVTAPEGVRLEARTVGGLEAGQLLLHVRGRALRPSEVIALEYGASAAGARADRHAGGDARLWFAVDGDGDGVRGLIVDSPRVDVVADAMARLVLHGPSTLAPGASASFTVAALDRWANAAPDGSEGAVVELASPADGWSVPQEVTLGSDGHASFQVTAPLAGEARLLRLEASVLLPGGATARARANPLRVGDGLPTVSWVDLHGHSGLSDGTGRPDEYLAYARDIARLDGVALTDHDHFGVQFLDATPELWRGIREAIEEAHEPGRFVTVHGFEWTNWIYGHRHVLHFDAPGSALEDLPLISSIDEATDEPTELWRALSGRPSLTLAHHSSGAPIPVDWTVSPDPELEPLTEVTSVHGQSEAPDAPRAVAGSVPGNYVRDALARGYRLGFVGSGDSHDGHPGLAHLSPAYGWRGGANEVLGRGGVAAVLDADATRASLLEALRARRTYATSGPRILVLARLAGTLPGGAVPTDEALELAIDVHGTDALARVDLVRSDRGVIELAQPSGLDARYALDVAPLDGGGWLYLRVFQAGGGAAWVGPWFTE